MVRILCYDIGQGIILDIIREHCIRDLGVLRYRDPQIGACGRVVHRIDRDAHCGNVAVIHPIIRPECERIGPIVVLIGRVGHKRRVTI